MGDDGAKHHVLVAEDDKALRESLVRVLRFEGYEVEAVGDGAKALEAVDARVPDAVVLDVMMPVVDGLAACRRLREHHRLLPILMLTARHEVADRVAGLDAGADDYLVKPFALDELLARLRALMRRSGANDGDEVPSCWPGSAPSCGAPAPTTATRSCASVTSRSTCAAVWPSAASGRWS
jgi:DNA-binding response OmpR family regulator